MKSIKDFNLKEVLEKAKELQNKSAGFQANTIPLNNSHSCQKCQDNEFTIGVKDGVEVAIPCECKQKKAIARAFKSSRITFEFQQKTFDTFELGNRPTQVQGAYRCALAYLSAFDRLRNEKHNSIALLGNPGCGKTHLLMAIANALMTKGVSVLYFPWVEGFNEIKDDLSLTEERIRKMQNVDLLYIDDMWKGRREPTPFQFEQAFAIINHRYMEKKPTLISSEKSIDQMCDLDEGIGSRINEMCRDFRVLLKGKDLNYRMREDAS